MPVFFTFLNIRIWWGMQSSSCPRNHQTYLHVAGCYDYRSDVMENFWDFVVHVEMDLVWFWRKLWWFLFVG